MFYVLTITAGILFIAHVVLLLISFPDSKLASKRYFYSHLTLWLTGTLIFLLALLYSGSGRSSFLDYFNNSSKQMMIIAFTFGLSLLAHIIVKWGVMPLIAKNQAQ